MWQMMFSLEKCVIFKRVFQIAPEPWLTDKNGLIFHDNFFSPRTSMLIKNKRMMTRQAPSPPGKSTCCRNQKGKICMIGLLHLFSLYAQFWLVMFLCWLSSFQLVSLFCSTFGWSSVYLMLFHFFLFLVFLFFIWISTPNNAITRF